MPFHDCDDLSERAGPAPTVAKSVRWWIGVCDRPAEGVPRRQDGVALAMRVPALAAAIALAGASHGALLDHARGGSAALDAATSALLLAVSGPAASALSIDGRIYPRCAACALLARRRTRPARPVDTSIAAHGGT
jgi:hypothetical protein